MKKLNDLEDINVALEIYKSIVNSTTAVRQNLYRAYQVYLPICLALFVSLPKLVSIFPKYSHLLPIFLFILTIIIVALLYQIMYELTYIFAVGLYCAKLEEYISRKVNVEAIDFMRKFGEAVKIACNEGTGRILYNFFYIGATIIAFIYDYIVYTFRQFIASDILILFLICVFDISILIIVIVGRLRVNKAKELWFNESWCNEKEKRK